MMASTHEHESTTLIERDAPFPSLPVDTGNHYQDVYFDEAYPFIQRQIAEFSEIQRKALASNDLEQIGRAIALEKSIKRSIQQQLSLGYLYETSDEEEITVTASEYFLNSLNMYRAYGADPRIVPAVDFEQTRVEFVPVPGINVSQLEYDTVYAPALEQPGHITVTPVETLPAEEQAAERKSWRRFKRVIRSLGSLANAESEVAIHSGEITTTLKPGEPTRVMPVVS